MIAKSLGIIYEVWSFIDNIDSINPSLVPHSISPSIQDGGDKMSPYQCNFYKLARVTFSLLVFT